MDNTSIDKLSNQELLDIYKKLEEYIEFLEKEKKDESRTDN